MISPQEFYAYSGLTVTQSVCTDTNILKYISLIIVTTLHFLHFQGQLQRQVLADAVLALPWWTVIIQTTITVLHTTKLLKWLHKLQPPWNIYKEEILCTRTWLQGNWIYMKKYGGFCCLCLYVLRRYITFFCASTFLLFCILWCKIGFHLKVGSHLYVSTDFNSDSDWL